MTMTCKQCGSPITPDMKFCPVCGLVLDKAEKAEQDLCEYCGAKLEKGVKICPCCGAPVSPDVNTSEKSEKLKFESRPEPEPAVNPAVQGCILRCPQCGAELAADAKFCPVCGLQINENISPAAASDEQKYCPVCGAKLEKNTPFCLECGAKIQGEGKSYQETIEVRDTADHRLIAAMSYLGILVLVPVFTVRNSPFVRYHANQGLVLMLIYISLNILLGVLGAIFTPISDVISGLLSLVYLVSEGLFLIFSIKGIINVARGKKKPLPLIGKIKLLK